MEPEPEIPDFYEEQGNVVFEGRKATERKLIGEDLNRMPYSSLCFLSGGGSKCLKSAMPSNRASFSNSGTIFLIGEYYGLTAAHLLVNKFTKPEYSKQITGLEHMKVYPKANGEIMIPNRSQNAAKIIDYRIHSRYAYNVTTKNNMDFDIAVVKFDQPIGKHSSLGLNIVSDKELKDQKIFSAGYPADKVVEGNYHGKVVRGYAGEGIVTQTYFQPNIFEHNIETSPGQSGSPIFLKGTDVLIGMHTMYDSQKEINYGIMFTEAVISYIYGWIQEMEHLPFYVSSVEHGKSTVYKYHEYKMKHFSNHLSRTFTPKDRQDMTIFDFNWFLNPSERDIYDIQGSTIEKRRISQDRSIVCTYQSLELGRTSKISCRIKKLENEIGIGLLTQKAKNSILDIHTRHKNWESFCFFNFSAKKNGNRAEESFKVLFDRKMKRFQNFFPLNQGHYIWNLIVNLRSNDIQIERGGEPSLWQIPKQFQGQKLYFAVYLSGVGDCIEVVSEEQP